MKNYFAVLSAALPNAFVLYLAILGKVDGHTAITIYFFQNIIVIFFLSLKIWKLTRRNFWEYSFNLSGQPFRPSKKSATETVGIVVVLFLFLYAIYFIALKDRILIPAIQLTAWTVLSGIFFFFAQQLYAYLATKPSYPTRERKWNGRRIKVFQVDAKDIVTNILSLLPLHVLVVINVSPSTAGIILPLLVASIEVSIYFYRK